MGERSFSVTNLFLFLLRRLVILVSSLRGFLSLFSTSPSSNTQLISFLPSELSRFISSGRLSCTIDKVNGIVSTTRGGETGKEKQYDSVVMKGDVLLGKLQRLSKVLY